MSSYMYIKDICVYIYIYIYICVHIHILLHSNICICICICMYVYIYILGLRTSDFGVIKSCNNHVEGLGIMVAHIHIYTYIDICI